LKIKRLAVLSKRNIGVLAPNWHPGI
jgi:hypothetical protein